MIKIMLMQVLKAHDTYLLEFPCVAAHTLLFFFDFPSLVSLLDVYLAISNFVSIQSVENLYEEVVCFSFFFYKSGSECE